MRLRLFGWPSFMCSHPEQHHLPGSSKEGERQGPEVPAGQIGTASWYLLLLVLNMARLRLCQPILVAKADCCVTVRVSYMILTLQTSQLCPAPVATLQTWHAWSMREGLGSHRLAWGVCMCSFCVALLDWGGDGSSCYLQRLFWPEMCENSCCR